MKMILVFLLILLTCSAFAQDLIDKDFDLAVAVGYIPSAKIEGSYKSDFPANQTMSFNSNETAFLKLMFDYYLLPTLSVGANINYAPFKLEEDIDLGTWDGTDHKISSDVQIHMFEFNSSIKTRIIVTERFLLKPGIYLGYRATLADDSDAVETGFAFNASLEGQYYFKDFFVFTDIGFLSQPYGGISGVAYIKASPAFYFSAGIGI